MFKRNDRTTVDNIKLGSIFIFLGGYTGILSSLILGHFVNCMSGDVTETGISLGHFDLNEALILLLILFFYIFGSFLSTKILDKFEQGHIPILLFESALLILVAFSPVTLALYMAALAMGLQNGMTTCITWKSGKIRTTHVTGTTTDIGVFLAEDNKKGIIISVFQLISYFSGAIIGLLLAQKVGNLAFVIEGLILLAIIFFDTVIKTTKHKLSNYLKERLS